MKISKKHLYYLFIFIGSVFILFSLFYGLYLTKSLDENPAETRGVILETRQWKGRSSFIYKYTVEGEEYSDAQRYNPDDEYFDIGDSCRVIYDSTNPSFSRVLKDQYGYYSIRKTDFINNDFIKKAD